MLRKELHQKGIDCTISQCLKSMNAINRVTTFYGSVDKPSKIEAFIAGDELASKIEDAYGLQQIYYS